MDVASRPDAKGGFAQEVGSQVEAALDTIASPSITPADSKGSDIS